MNGPEQSFKSLEKVKGRLFSWLRCPLTFSSGFFKSLGHSLNKIIISGKLLSVAKELRTGHKALNLLKLGQL